jgi:regulator of sigma E protease
LKLIFSPSTGAYKQVGGFKAIFDIFRVLELGNVLDYHRAINYAWCYELIAYSGTRWRSCDVFYYMKLLVVKPSDKFLENA